MTSDMTTTDEGGKRRISLSEKYLKPIDNFAFSATVDGLDLSTPDDESFDALIEMMTTLHWSHLSETNAMRIVYRTFFDLQRDVTNSEQGTAAFSHEKLRSALRERLQSAIESIPRPYTLRITLPGVVCFGTTRIEIAEDVFFVMNNSGGAKPKSARNALSNPLALEFEYQLGLASALRSRNPGSAVHLEFNFMGYCDQHADSPAAFRCLAIAKQCAFILNLHGITRDLTGKAKGAATIEERQDGTITNLEIPDSLSTYFGKISLNESKLKVVESGGMLLGRSERDPVNDDEKILALKTLLKAVLPYFEGRADEDFPSIAAAIEWHQDSLLAENETFAYLAVCIGLEAILGSSTHLDEMSKRLFDRYAFLLGRTRAQREMLGADYKAVLDLRGKLVHAKTARLEAKDRKVLIKARSILSLVIRHELAEMYRRVRSSKT